MATARATLVAAVTAIAAAALFLALLPAGGAVSQNLDRVFVTNFPDPQRIAGSVAVQGTVRHAGMQRLLDILVSPVSPRETTRLAAAGVLETDGFTSMVVSLNGQTKGKVLKPGAVGAILIPDEESVVRAFEEDGQVHFGLELRAPSAGGPSPHFAAEPARFTVGFPRYRVFLFNTSDKSASVNVYAYLTN